MTRIRGWFGRLGWVLIVIVGFSGETEAAVTLKAFLSVSEKYNDNVSFTGTDREEELTTMIIPGLIATYDSRSVAFSGRYQGSAEFHMRQPEANRYDHTASVDLSFPFLSLKGLDLRMTEAVTYTQDLPAFSFDDQEANEGIQVGRTDKFRNRARAAVGYAWSPRLNTAASYSNIVTRYGGGGLEDSVVHDTGLKSEYLWSRRTRLMTSYGASIVDYETANEIVVHRVAIGANHQMSPTLVVDGDVGVARSSRGTTRLTLNAGLSRDVQSGTLSLRYIRNLGTGGGVTTAESLSQRVVGQATREMGRNVSASLQLGYGRTTFLSNEGSTISLYQAIGAVRVHLRPWLGGSLSYAYSEQHGRDVNDADVRRNVVILALTATTPPWRSVE
jgi:hypothetical protein